MSNAISRPAAIPSFSNQAEPAAPSECSIKCTKIFQMLALTAITFTGICLLQASLNTRGILSIGFAVGSGICLLPVSSVMGYGIYRIGKLAISQLAVESNTKEDNQR